MCATAATPFAVVVKGVKGEEVGVPGVYALEKEKNLINHILRITFQYTNKL